MALTAAFNKHLGDGHFEDKFVKILKMYHAFRSS